MEELIYSQSLTIAMGVLCGLTCVILMVMFLMGRVRKKESPSDAVLVCNIFFTFFLTSLFQLISVILQAVLNSNASLRKTSRNWCKFVGAFGLFSIILCHLAMLSLAAYLVWCQVKLKKFKRNNTTWIKVILFFQYLLAGAAGIVPVLPINYFSATLEYHEASLCLPLHAPEEKLRDFTLALLLLETVTAGIVVLMLSFVSFRMHRQQINITDMIPMEARVLHKHANVVKRLGLMLLTIITFHLPAMGALLGLIIGVNISANSLQWIFGFVSPLGGLFATIMYLCLAGLKKATMSQFLPRYKLKEEERSAVIENGKAPKAKPENIYICDTPENSLVSFEKSPNKPRELKRMFSGTVPGEVNWIQDVVLAGGGDVGKFGIGEWQTSNGSPRRGLVKVFPPSQYKKWTWETSIMAKLNHFGRHTNIVEFLWASTSSQIRIVNNGEEFIEEPIKFERYLCTAYYPHGTLRGVLRTYPTRFTENLAHLTALQVSQGLAFLHEHQISHQDLTTKNCHIGGRLETMTLRVVITNFGKSMDLSKHKTDEINEDFSGFSLYSPKNEKENAPGSSSLQDLHLIVGEVQRLYANDIRAFALILLELLETVRQNHKLSTDETDLAASRRRYSHQRPVSALPSVRIPQVENGTVQDVGKGSDRSVSGQENHSYIKEGCYQMKEIMSDNDPSKRHSVCSSDSGISSHRESMRSKGSSVGSSFSSKDKRKTSGESRKISGADTGAVQALMRIKHTKRCKDESETDTTEIGDSSNSSVEELDRLASLPNFAQRHRKSDFAGIYSINNTEPSSSEQDATQADRNELEFMNEKRKLQHSKSLEGDERSKEDVDNVPSAIPRSSNSFSKFYVIRSSDPKSKFNLTPVSTPSPKLRSKERNMLLDVPNGRPRSRPLSLEDGASGKEDGPMRSMTPDLLMPNFNDVGTTSTFPRGGTMIVPQETVPAGVNISNRRASDFGVVQSSMMSSWGDPRVYGGVSSLPRRPKKQEEDSCPSNLTMKHMVQCQELLNLMDGLRALSLINRVHAKEDCHKVVMRWLSSLRVESCLYKQLAQVLKAVWTREPPYLAHQVFKKLDNCLTEVDL